MLSSLSTSSGILIGSKYGAHSLHDHHMQLGYQDTTDKRLVKLTLLLSQCSINLHVLCRVGKALYSFIPRSHGCMCM